MSGTIERSMAQMGKSASTKQITMYRPHCGFGSMAVQIGYDVQLNTFYKFYICIFWLCDVFLRLC